MDLNSGSVYVVDDDEAFRDSLSALFESVGLEAKTFEDALSFLDHLQERPAGCLVLDIRMPGMSGLELQQALRERNCDLPIVFITGHGDVPMAVRAMKSGAFDFLTKPFSHQELLDSVHAALKGRARAQEKQGNVEEIARRRDLLTPREREVMELVVDGLANKVIANRLGISQRTVEIHRSQVMEKMEADSLAQLVRMAVALESSAETRTDL